MKRDHYDDDQTIGVREFQIAVEERVDPDDPSTMMNVGRELVRLSNNRDLLAAGFARQLGSWDTHSFSMYSPQSSILTTFGRFIVRVNFWPVLPDDPRRRKILGQLLSYYGFHDHNFSFLTTHFFGPGYETDMYAYDYNAVEGFIDEPVELTPQGRHRLAKGDVFLYQQGIDIHSQIPPDEMSGSINLMLREPEGASIDEQYAFDVRRSRISKYIDSIGHKQNSLLGFCRTMGDETTARRVEKLVADHPAKSMRSFACVTLGNLGKRMEIDRSVLETARHDSSRLVRESAEQALANVAG